MAVSLTIGAPSSNVIADQLVVRLVGAPPIDSTLNGQTQQFKVGDIQQTNALALSGGEAITISGPSGSQKVRLPDDITIRELVTVLNGYSDTTGAELAYDERTGDLSLTTNAPGLGSLFVASEDMTGGAGVGLFDADVSSASVVGVGVEGVQLAVDMLDSRTGAAATGATLIGDVIGNMPGLFDEAFNHVDGKHLAFMAGGETTTIELSGTTIEDFVQFMNSSGVNGSIDWDSDTMTLSATDDLTATTTSLAVGATTSLNDIMTWVEAQLTDPALGYSGTTFSVGTESLEIEGTTLQSVIDAINVESFDTGLTASLVGGRLEIHSSRGEVLVHSDDLTLSGEQVGLLDLNSLNINEIGGIGNEPTIFAMDILDEVGSAIPDGDTPIRRILGNGVGFDAVDGSTMTLSDGVNPSLVFNLTATTTIDDIVNTINAATIDARASYIDGSLRVVGSSGLSIQSSSMNSLVASHGLLDQAAGTPGDNGAASIDRHPSIELGFQDENGSARTVTLFHDPSLNDGFGFRNIAGGPQPILDQVNQSIRTIFSAYDPDAWQLTLRDTRVDGHTSIVASDKATTARRESTLVVQTGADANQTTRIDFIDMRAEALGHSAGLGDEGFRSLGDILLKQALINGQHDDALSVIDAALEEVNLARGEAGAIVSNGLEATLDSLRVSVEQLTSAESRIRDTDFAVESAEYARQNILVQAATSMLAQANQVPQSILQLLQ